MLIDISMVTVSELCIQFFYSEIEKNGCYECMSKENRKNIGRKKIWSKIEANLYKL